MINRVTLYIIQLNTRDDCDLQGCGFGRDVSVSRRTNVSSLSRLGLGPMRLGSPLGLGAICLGLGPVGLVSGLGPLRLVETFCAGARRACCSCS